jgi:transcriptional regulator with XRE-family HTH domain
MADPVFTVGDVVRKLRKEKRWSIRKLATESGVGRMTISDIERNQSNYQKETLEDIAKAFGKTGAELEAMVVAPRPPHRRASDADLPAEWVAFTKRVTRLTRQAQMAVLLIVMAFEEAGAVRSSTQPDGPPLFGTPDQPEAP